MGEYTWSCQPTSYSTPFTIYSADLWHPNSTDWNDDYIASIFYNQVVQQITSLPVVPTDDNDTLRWIPSRDGKCTTKAVYRHLIRQETIQLPAQGPRSITNHANYILQRAWKSKDLPPLIKTFTWRLIRRALSTGARAGRYSVHIDEHCSTCQATEDNAHLFFHCQLPRAVWFSFDPPLRTDNLPHELDGIQLILQFVLPNSTTDAMFLIRF